MGPPIKLHDMPTTLENNIRGGFDSEEELNKSRDGKMGISKTQDIEVTFSDDRKAAEDDSIGSFRHA
jgi:hypothetical protein